MAVGGLWGGGWALTQEDCLGTRAGTGTLEGCLGGRDLLARNPGAGDHIGSGLRQPMQKHWGHGYSLRRGIEDYCWRVVRGLLVLLNWCWCDLQYGGWVWRSLSSFHPPGSAPLAWASCCHPCRKIGALGIQSQPSTTKGAHPSPHPSIHPQPLPWGTHRLPIGSP